MNRIDRLVAILIYMEGRRVTRAEDIADEFATSIRTVYRDIAALAEAGVPIIGEAGVGYSIMRGYHLPPVHFTTEEATALVTAGMLMDRFADSSLMSSMASALGKIRAVLPPDRQDHVARLERRMSLQNTRQPNQPANLFLIQKALADRTVLRISYRGSGAAEPLRREVEPLGLTYYGDRWHLIAWCRVRQDYRDFRTDRIQAIGSSAEQFGPHEDFSLNDFLGRREDTAPPVTGSIRVDPFAAERLRKEAPFKIIREERDERGITFAIEGAKWDWYLGWLLSFGNRLVVIEPDNLRTLLFETARATADHHSLQRSQIPEDL
ncbi:MAG: YafY family transcriptional regulator [Verrucomicrobia bacterium]|nr:YafY family transcriptional regulator [Verrucomicrobiota bacterium]